MGCDIHAYVEYRRTEAEHKTWWPFGGRINPGRDYEVFSNLAGVRNRGDKAPMFQPRGLPDDLSWESSGDYWTWIAHDRPADSDSVEAEKASRWHAHGARYRGTVGDGDDRPRYVGDPDAHTPSWVTPDEWEMAITAAAPVDVKYRALLAAMRVLESDGNEVRVVFWFDN